jgi:hypothetical protein
MSDFGGEGDQGFGNENPDVPTGFDSAETKQKKNDDPRQGLPDSVKVEEANTLLELQPGDPTAAGPWVQYDGIATVRVITQSDWQEMGIDSDKEVQWNYLNKKRVPISRFSDEELQYLLRCDGRFSVVE